MRHGSPFFLPSILNCARGLFVEEPLAQTEIGFAVAGRGNKGAFLAAAEDSGADHEALLVPDPMPEAEYLRRFDVVRRGLLPAIRF